MRICSFCLFIGVLCSVKSMAQSYHTALSTGWSFATPPLVNEKNSLDRLFIQMSIPLKLKSGDYLAVNPEVHQQTFDLDTLSIFTCFKTGLSLNYIHIGEKRTTIGIFNISNNFQRAYFNGHRFQIGGGFLISKKKSPSLKWKYGLYVNNEYFGLLVVPLFGVDYKISSKRRIFGIMPQYLRYEYKWSSKMRSGFLFEAPVFSYQLKRDLYRYIDQRQISLGAFSSFYLSKGLVLELAVKPMIGKVKLFEKNRIYDVNVLGVGFGGSRTAEKLPLHGYRTPLAIDITLNYRIEIE